MKNIQTLLLHGLLFTTLLLSGAHAADSESESGSDSESGGPAGARAALVRRLRSGGPAPRSGAGDFERDSSDESSDDGDSAAVPTFASRVAAEALKKDFDDLLAKLRAIIDEYAPSRETDINQRLGLLEEDFKRTAARAKMTIEKIGWELAESDERESDLLSFCTSCFEHATYAPGNVAQRAVVLRLLFKPFFKDLYKSFRAGTAPTDIIGTIQYSVINYGLNVIRLCVKDHVRGADVAGIKIWIDTILSVMRINIEDHHCSNQYSIHIGNLKKTVKKAVNRLRRSDRARAREIANHYNGAIAPIITRR